MKKIESQGIFVGDKNMALSKYNDDTILEWLSKGAKVLEDSKYKSSSIKILRKAIKKYPRIPVFYTFLFDYYYNNKHIDKAKAFNRIILKKFPNDFYGRINKIEFLLNDVYASLEDIENIFSSSASLSDFYPNEKYYSEPVFFEFYSTHCYYAAKLGNREKVEDHLMVLLEYYEHDSHEINKFYIKVSDTCYSE